MVALDFELIAQYGRTLSSEKKSTLAYWFGSLEGSLVAKDCEDPLHMRTKSDCPDQSLCAMAYKAAVSR